MAYKTQVVDIGCCQNEINPQDLESKANMMEKQGYKLVQVYIDSTRACCCSSKKSVIMIFNNDKIIGDGGQTTKSSDSY